ncbi:MULTISPECIES: type VI secretion system-associated protein TagF [unclassified Bordetella]|uniref:type VI secretion system-associated protein TagF n=1 Tax=unclassified Bordetella TaxID=2630031 RepID=UPI0013279A12|nr:MULTISPECIES: type VI secretion system-associated protein TagF [unclassified Bordetella]MVW70258.1 type VI secretion system-associated protein TagF [Bordetella sp. 15P40C-2]MVW78011.1 type VI secretion system-associated protein TagF [Bordetella sp. 02P26C-1]
MNDVTAQLGWYGKIPASGDFVHRRLPRELIAWWDRWLQFGLAAVKQAPNDSASRSFATAPIWNFAIPSGPSGGAVQLGCLAPSRDRVGRAYPLCVTWTVAAAHYDAGMLDGATEFYRKIGAGILSAVRHGCATEQFDRELLAVPLPCAARPSVASSSGSDIMDILNAGRDAVAAPLSSRELAAWPELSLCFNPSSHTSYWWTNQADGASHQTYIHGGALNAALFTRLFASLPAWR